MNFFNMETTEEECVGAVDRVMICQGSTVLKRGWKRNKRYLTLFNDVLVISSNLNKKKFKVKHIIPLTYLWLGAEADMFRTDIGSPSKSIHLYWPMGNAVATFRSMEQAIWWYFFLKRSIIRAKNQNQTVLSMQIFTEDIAQCNNPLHVTATNSETVNDIIIKLLPMIGKHNTDDYQLWFFPGHEEAPRLLQGHEYLHDVIMINIQKNFSSRDSKIFTALPSLPGLCMKYLNMEAQGQFILKPRNPARSQQQRNAKKNSVKKQKTSLTSCLERGSTPHQNQVCSNPRVNKREKLFGKDLSSICHDGNMPAAVLDMLSVIKAKGPTTEGIFIISPRITLCQTLKEKLDSGEKVDISKQSVHVVAWILKDFLQNITGSLMIFKLYNKWLAIPMMVNDKEKIAAVKRLVGKLPPLNAVLLRQLLEILHEIQKSTFNHMTSYNLSVAIAPYIFVIPSSGNKRVSNDITKKISLLTFMIKNTPKIFEEDLTSVQYETSLMKASCSQKTLSNIGNIKETDYGLSRCPSRSTCTLGYNVFPRSLSASLLCHCITEKCKCDSYTIQPATSKNPPPLVNKQQLFEKFPSSAYKGGILPAPILEMLSIIAEKGQNSDQIFRTLPERSNWFLKDKIFSEQQINWDEESVVTIASVLKDFIKNIQGSLLSSDLYENWLSVPNESSLAGKIFAIQSILLKMPQPNFLLLKHLIRVLSKIKNSPMNQLDAYSLSVRIAPHLLWDATCRYSVVGSDISKKMSLIQTMIDNNKEIFGEKDSKLSKDNQNTSSDIKLPSMSINSPGQTLDEKEIIRGHSGHSVSDTHAEDLEISSSPPKEEDTTAEQNGTTSTYNCPQEKILRD